MVHTIWSHYGGDFVMKRCTCGWRSLLLQWQSGYTAEGQAALAGFAQQHEAAAQ